MISPKVTSSSSASSFSTVFVSRLTGILPEFVSYLGERGVLCVENGSYFCTPVPMNMCILTFQALRLSTFIFNKCSEKIVTIIFVVKSFKGFGWNNVGPASQTVAQH